MSNVKGYTLKQEKELADLKAKGKLYYHEKSGAHIVTVENDDENKVFFVGFKTPPEDSTGVAHIIEHTVLCGSEKYPVKDPFIELEKSSLNTFLNAMTYSDKTVYPVASCNDKDIKNLMDVYLDAVFNPNIYNEEKIFKQEGWHYELDSVDGELKYNGVVFNEMKGVFSSPDGIIERAIEQSLFPDTPYGVESGGDPKNIPDLNYEDYLEFHRRYYHPTNSYIYLYGDMDMEERLKYLDENYLSKYDKIDIDPKIPVQESFDKKAFEEVSFSASTGDDISSKSYLSYNAVIYNKDNPYDNKAYVAWQIITYVLTIATGAPIRDRLIEEGIGSEIEGGVEDCVKQPYFYIIAKNAPEDKRDRFIEIIEEELEKVVREGINKESVKSSINYLEFQRREADFGMVPKGLSHGLDLMKSWLYDIDKPFEYINILDAFDELKELLDKGYFENLIEKYLIKNNHKSVVTAKPEIGLSSKMQKDEKARLDKYMESLSDEEKQKIVEETAELKKYQEEKSPKEDLDKIPTLDIEDIKKEAFKPSNIEKSVLGTKLIHHDFETSGIYYVSLYFNINDLVEKYAPYIGLLALCLGDMDTEKYGKLELNNEIMKRCGGFSFIPAIIENEEKGINAYFEFKSKMLAENLEDVVDLFYEVINNTHLDDKVRLRQIISEERSNLYIKLLTAGHSAAAMRCASYYSISKKCDDSWIGIGFFHFLEWLEKNFEEYGDTLVDILKDLVKAIFSRDNIISGITTGEDAYNDFEAVHKKALERLPQSRAQMSRIYDTFKESTDINEGFYTPGQVQFVARTGNYKKLGFKYNGVYQVLRHLLSYEYLWNEVRVKGGAYGVMCNFTREGNGIFTSYRDPNLRETNDVYESVPEYIKNFDVSHEDMKKFIIGTIGSLDTPLTPRMKGGKSMGLYLSGTSAEDVQRSRDEMLAATTQDIRNCADMVRAILDCKYICALGTEEKIERDKDMFEVIEGI